MINIVNKVECCGCEACYNACPKNCIEMKADEEGFLYPHVNQDTCINCGLCEKVCPVINRVPEKETEQKAYLVQHRDDDVRKDSSSGGAFTAIATWVLQQGGVVFGAAYDENFSVYHTYVERIEDLYRFRNSKYVQSNIGNSFVQAKKFLDEGRWVCFSGTPCQIEGLSSFLQKKYKKIVLVDVVCHGIPSPLVWKKYLEIQNVNDINPDYIRFRDKYYGYKYSTMSIVKDGKTIYHAGSQKDPMLRAFFSDICDRPICYECPFKKRYRVSDITVWDCFTVYKFDKKIDDDKGTTRVLCHTELGNKVIQDANCHKIKVDANSLVKGVNEMFYSVSMNPNRADFFSDVVSMDAKKLFNKYFPLTTKVRLMTFIRLILITTGFYGFVKKILYTIRGL